MGFLNSVQTGEVVALGWTLLHFCWQSTVIAVVYAVIDRCFERSSAPVRYSIALCTLALFPLVAAATFVEQLHLVSHVRVDQQQFAVSQLGAKHTALIEQLPMAAPAVGNSELWIAQHAGFLLLCMDGIWLAGVLLLALRAAYGWWQLRTLRRRANALVPQQLRTSFDKLASQYRLSRRVVLRVSDEVISPMAVGLWRTVVLMPLSAALSMPPDQLEAVLAHELTHVWRWDYLCNLLQTSAECLFFFQPAVWWVSRRVREFREVCCDEAAAKACASPVVYAEALLHMEEQRAKHLQLAIALHGNGGTLLNRIRRVMGENAMEQTSMSGIRLVAVGLVLAGLYLGPQVAHGMRAEYKKSEPVVSTNTNVVQPVSVAKSAVMTQQPAAAVAFRDPSPGPVSGGVEMSSANPGPRPNAAAVTLSDSSQQGGGMEYMQKMRDAGYPLDLDKDLNEIVKLRSVGVTPEYAKSMSQTGLGIPTLHELIALKSEAITPEYIASLKGSVLAPSTFHDVVTVKSLGLTPGYAKEFESLGLGRPTLHDIIGIKSVGVTPEYLAALKASGVAPADLHEAVGMKAVGVTPEYATAMTAVGFPGMNAHELIAMRVQRMTPEYARWLKTTFPDADSRAMHQAATFHIDADFVARAKASGFNSASLDKLTKLKMSGLLN